MRGLEKLRMLTIRDAPKLLEGPQLVGLIALEEVELDGLHELRALPDLRGLEKLRELIISGAPKLLRLPQFAGSFALEKLGLDGLLKVRVLPDMRRLTNLRSVSLKHAPQLIQQPRLYDFVPQLPNFIPSVCHGCKVYGYYSLRCDGSCGMENIESENSEADRRNQEQCAYFCGGRLEVAKSGKDSFQVPVGDERFYDLSKYLLLSTKVTKIHWGEGRSWEDTLYTNPSSNNSEVSEGLCDTNEINW
jgi:hypothetical protein